MQISGDVIDLGLWFLRIFLDLRSMQNSLYPTQPHSVIANYLGVEHSNINFISTLAPRIILFVFSLQIWTNAVLMPGCVTTMPNVSTLAGLTIVCVMLGLREMVKTALVGRYC